MYDLKSSLFQDDILASPIGAVSYCVVIYRVIINSDKLKTVNNN